MVFPKFKPKITIKSLPLPKQRHDHKDLKTVVLDMDETLLHSVFLREIKDVIDEQSKDVQILKNLKRSADFFYTNKKYGDVAVFLRPGLNRFLHKLSDKFEVVLWTASERSYAKPIIDFLDPQGTLLPYRLY